MNLPRGDARTLSAALALLAVLALLVGGAVLGMASLGAAAAVAVALAALGAAGLSLYGGATRAHLLARYLATRPMGVQAAVGLEPGVRWLRVEGEVAGRTGVEAVLTDEDVAARALRIERRSYPAGLPWPALRRRVLVDETEAPRLTLLNHRSRARIEGDGAVTVLAPAERLTLGPGDEPSWELRQALQGIDGRFEDLVGRTDSLEHRLVVAERQVRPGQRVQAFGLLRAERDDGSVLLRPGGGRLATAAVASGGWALPLRYLRGAVVGLAGAGVLVWLAWFALSPVVG